VSAPVVAPVVGCAVHRPSIRSVTRPRRGGPHGGSPPPAAAPPVCGVGEPEGEGFAPTPANPKAVWRGAVCASVWPVPASARSPWSASVSLAALSGGRAAGRAVAVAAGVAALGCRPVRRARRQGSRSEDEGRPNAGYGFCVTKPWRGHPAPPCRALRRVLAGMGGALPPVPPVKTSATGPAGVCRTPFGGLPQALRGSAAPPLGVCRTPFGGLPPPPRGVPHPLTAVPHPDPGSASPRSGECLTPIRGVPHLEGGVLQNRLRQHLRGSGVMLSGGSRRALTGLPNPPKWTATYTTLERLRWAIW